jgi:arsenate reductase (thioredoxin)
MATALFVCLHNAGRSQMSQALFECAAERRHSALSAGTTPGERVHPEVVEVMRELGIDLADRVPQALTTELAQQADVVVTMGCGDACPYIPGKRYIDWNLPDPKGRPIEEVRATRDEIQLRVSALVAELDAAHAQTGETSDVPGVQPPEIAAEPPAQRVNRLVPFINVADVERSVAFYHHLGFTPTSVYKHRDLLAWAALESDGAELMFQRSDAIEAERQGILFYLYSDDLAALRDQLLAAGIEAGEIEDGSPGPRQEMRVVDPDGYVLMVAQNEEQVPAGPAARCPARAA